ncbi:DUF1788 domain-containing protein, partial [Halorubrum sp. SP3]|uniref:BREX protein BrxB domain-containing protein n=2 Tax=Halorubrum TaxID=56688 RepID=UPI0010F4FD10
TFAQGQHGIRNPFVIAAVEPAVEHRVADRLETWSDGQMESPEIPDAVTVQPIWLDELLPQTDVYKLLVDLGDPLADLDDDTSPGERIEGTMQDQLAEELVQQMVEHELSEEQLETQSHVVLLLNLGSLYPFTRASELLDELDRRNVKSTIGIPFPGDVVGGKLSFFGGESRHYYPAHQIDGQIQGVHLQ